MKLLSIVVPIYNSQKWLPDCLSSLLLQDLDHTEYEIVCVDDGSTDASAQIVSDFCEKYGNVRLLQKKNGGVSDARNMGLEYICGKYVWFVDSDDLVRPNCMGFLKKILEMHEPETLSFNIKPVPEEYKIAADNETLEYAVDAALKSYNNVYAAIIRVDLIQAHGIRFKNGLHYGEDTLFQYHVYMYRMGKLPSITVKNDLYYYRQQGDSAMHHRSAGAYDKHVQDLITLARIYKKDYDDKIVDDEKKLGEVKLRQYMAIEGALTILPKSQYACKTFINSLKEEGLYPYPVMLWKVKKAKGFKQKLVAFCRSLFGMSLFYKAYYSLCKFMRIGA